MLDSLPLSLASLAALTELNLSGRSALTCLPSCVGELPTLKRLNMTACTQLSTLCATLPTTLEALTLNHCHQLRELPEGLSALTSLQQLYLNECSELTTMPDVTKLTELTALSLVGCGALESMPTGLHTLLGCCVTFDDGDVVVGS